MYKMAYEHDNNVIFYFDKCGNKHIFKGGNLAWRTNNPGLVRSRSHYALVNGSIGSCRGVAIFSHAEQGHKALTDWLHSKKYWNSSLKAISEHYDPKNSEAYTTKLASLIGVPKDKKIRAFTNQEFEKLLKTIEKLCGYVILKNQESFILPKITAKIETSKKEDSYLIGSDLVLSKEDAMDWVKTNRLDATIVHYRNGAMHLRSRPSHCIWKTQIREENIPPLQGEIETLVRSVGEKKFHQCIWGFINGIFNSKAGALESAEMISAAAGGEEVLSMPNDSFLLGLKDVGVCISLKLGVDTPIVRTAVNFFRYLLLLSEKDSSHPPVIVFAHSQGAIISEHALELLKPDEKKKIRIFTFGGGAFLTKDSCHPDSHNYASKNDMVCAVGSPYFQFLAIQKYLGLKAGFSLEELIKLWASNDALLYIESIDFQIIESFTNQRIKHYENLLDHISNITILDPDPNYRFEHQFCNDCYQNAIKQIIEKYKGSLFSVNGPQMVRELIYV